MIGQLSRYETNYSNVLCLNFKFVMEDIHFDRINSKQSWTSLTTYWAFTLPNQIIFFVPNNAEYDPGWATILDTSITSFYYAEECYNRLLLLMSRQSNTKWYISSLLVYFSDSSYRKLKRIITIWFYHLNSK